MIQVKQLQQKQEWLQQQLKPLEEGNRVSQHTALSETSGRMARQLSL